MQPRCPWCRAAFDTWSRAKIHVKHCASAKGRTVVKLKFGKYRDSDIQDVPSEYLSFLIASARETVESCQAELDRRELVEQAQMPMIRRLVESGYKTLAKQVHPDADGSDGREMTELNAAVQALREMVR
jgi:hypothetical protein